MSMKPTIWMNVTTSANWQRPPVGIVRVEQAICNGLQEIYGDGFKRCIWQGDRFIDAELISSHIGSEKNLSESSEKNNVEGKRKKELPPIFPLLPKRKALAVIVQGVLSLTPSAFRPIVNKILYRLKSTFFRIITSNLFKKKTSPIVWSNKPIQNNLNEEKGLFSKGDILISMGLDWDCPLYESFYYLRKSGVKVISCCYDLIPVFYPQYCVGNVSGIFSSYFIEIADGSDIVLCISKQSEADLRRFLETTGANVPITHVFPLGDNVPAEVSGNISDDVLNIFSEPFILFVSTVERRKNHEVLYRAYHLLCQQGKKDQLPKMVFVGMTGWGIQELLADLEFDPVVQDLFVRLDHVSDAELSALYKASLFCVFPSLYEGWGLPVGEALSLGKAVISSDRGSLPEVGGDLVVYVEPWSPHDWAREIYRMATDSEWRCKHENNIRENYQTRTWEQASQSISTVINSIL
ncbi:MAG: glycosyltransferase family 4 protein [Oleispira sp.]|nr:glycosyltransferase family 4 protein [Oleispira sp.]